MNLRHLRLAARFARHRFNELHPYEVQAVLLNACNLDCLYCNCPSIKTQILTTAQWRTIVRRLGKLGTLRLKWQGGEPTLRNDFDELCAEVKHAGILCAVVTNGLLIADNPALLNHVDEVVLSLDSLRPEPNDAVRGAGVNARVLKAIDVSLSRGKATFINMVVSRDSWDDLEPMMQFCEERGIGLNAQPIVQGRAVYSERAVPFMLENAQVRELYRRLAAWRRAGRPLMFAAATYEKAAAWDDYGVLARRSEGTSSCPMGSFYVHVEANGDVFPCVQQGADFTPKNFVRDGVDEALRHARFHNCGDCFSAYLNERKAIFGLRPHAVMEFLRRP